MGDSWIGGDIPGLQAMGDTLSQGPGLIEGIVGALSHRVDALADDANWSGDAAGNFRTAWTANAMQAGALRATVGRYGQIVGGLGDALAQVEGDLYNAADAARTRGASIGSRGEPIPLIVQGDPNAPEVAGPLAAQADYTDAYNSAMQLAQALRLDAADRLSTLSAEIEPADITSSWLDKAITLGDYIKGLYIVPNEHNNRLGKTIPAALDEARDRLRDARTRLNDEKVAYGDKGLRLPVDNPARLNHLDVVNDIRQLRDKLAAAESGQGHLPFSEILNTKTGDIGKLLPEIKTMVPKGLDFLGDIPVVDVAASGAVAELQAQDDMQKGMPGGEAHLKDYAAAGAGLAAGAVVAGALASSSTVVVPLVAGGIAVVGVGDLVYQGFHEHWAEDIHDHGVLPGIGSGIAHSARNTGQTFLDLGTTAIDGVLALWHKAVDS